MADLRSRAETRAIDGVTYRCWPLPFGAAKPLLTRAFKVAAPAFAAMMQGAQEGTDGGQEAVKAIGALATELTEADIERFSEAFGNASEYVDGEKNVPLVVTNQNMHFAGRPDVFLRWMIFSMEVNGFARFFSTLRDAAPLS